MYPLIYVSLEGEILPNQIVWNSKLILKPT